MVRKQVEENGTEPADVNDGTEPEIKVSRQITIPPPNFQHAVFHLRGTAPLVVHRFSVKTKQQIRENMERGKTQGSKRPAREPVDFNQLYEEARYRHKDGWDGFAASSIRNACISACRTVGFKMTIAKLSIFVEADGYDVTEPQIPLIRIIGDPVPQEDMARVETGQPYVTVRPAYHNWAANVKIKWDADQFTLEDLTNLMSRVGQQVGLCEGRPDSPKSAGMGWGTFEIIRQEAA